MKKISSGQMKRIYATARKLGIDNELLHDMVETQCKKKHISDLTMIQAGRMIDRLGQMEGRVITNTAGRKVPLVTKRQRYKIDQLVTQLGWDDNPKRLKGFCKKYTGVDNPDWMTKEQAWRLIEGLKALLQREPGGDGNEHKESRMG
ncbi:MAG TPA: phage protein GemA/Gp16 family protein [Syntrophomonadaceae bacterium]|nr:phage protein GemA/Gp16 family protein [Syntrophomonadaceae bacterium]